MNWILILGLFMTMIVTGLFSWLLIIIFKEKDLPSDDTIFKNFLSQYTSGYSYGSILSIVQGDKRIGIKFIPRDLDYVKLFKKHEKIDVRPQLIWIEKDKLLHFPKGTLSMHRHELWALPSKAEDLNDEIKKTKYGEVLMYIIEEMNMKTEESSILRKRIQAQNKLVEKSEGLEIVTDILEKMSEANKDLVKNLGKEQHKTFSDFQQRT